MQRRDFLKATSAATAAVGLGGLWPNIAHAAWGDVPVTVWPTPPDIKVLEIHLLGGVAPFESFYYRPPAGLRTRGFDTEITNLVWNAGCTNAPVGLEVDTLFGNDSNGKAIHLGPFAKPLWRPDIRDRMRVVVMSHDLLPHEAAIPYAMTGLRLGNANQASLGAAIAQRYQTISPRTLPYAYGLLSDTAGGGGINQLLTTTMGSFGRHPGDARPLVLKIGPGFATFLGQLQRTNMSADKDALLNEYRAQYRDWLRYQGAGDPTRSPAFRDYDTSVGALLQAASLSTFLSSISATIPSDAECAREPSQAFDTNPNATKTALQTAAFLLTRPNAAERARYVCVIDGGIEPRGGLPYDVHIAGHPGDTGSNLWNVFNTLAGLINNPATPPADPDKLNLSDTLIIITTEFGRTPCKSFPDSPPLGTVCDASSVGRDHWPQAFTHILIGGPITTRGVVGSISDSAGLAAVADISYSPTDLHAAALVAAGINPFESESYALGQLSASLSGLSHEQGMINLRQTILGVP